jgi:hypothetical protein
MPGNREIMAGVKVVLLGAVSVVTMNGCGGALVTGGTAGSGGTATTSGTAGEMTGRGGMSGNGATGGTAMAGTAGTGGDDSFGQPICSSEVYSAVPCAPDDVQLCYKACGVQLLGSKPYRCEGSLYQQTPGCSYDPARDYSCYKIPTAANTACPSNIAVQASTASDVPPCMLCNSLQGISGGMFLDSLGAAKTGYCVCTPPDAGGIRTWSCATDVSWPCPLGAGC